MRWCTVTVEVDGQEEQIVSTPGHKYYLPNNTESREIGLKQEHESYIMLSEKWVSACKLKSGDKVLLSEGKYGIIISVKIEELESPETTYNFGVEDFHTYFVSESNVLVHNRCVAKDGDYQAVVNEFNEKEAPHAHILKNRQRVAVVDSNGNIIKGAKQRGVVQFVSKHKDEIVSGIKKFYPRR